MKISNLFNSDDRAVSPVIGVILMVAITVILAAVIGTFVLGLGDQLGDTAPQASFTIDDANNSSITFVKTGGQSIEASDLSVSIGGTVQDASFEESSWQTGASKTISVNSDPVGEQTVRIVHNPSGNTIFEQTANFD